MKKMHFYLGAATLCIAGSALLFTGCEKDENAIPARQFSTQRGPNTATVQSGNGTPVHKAFIAEYNPSGGCSNGPIVLHNGDMWNFDPTTGASQTSSIGADCWTAACAHKPSGSFYLAKSDANTYGASELYTVSPHTGVLTFVTNITYSSNPLYVNEMEFGANGKLYILADGDDSHLYEMDMSTYAITQYTIFSSHRGTYLEALALDETNSKLYIAYETSTTSGTIIGEINTTTHTIGATASYSIPNCFTNNISMYSYSGSLYVVRDNGSGTGTIYTTAGTALSNTISCRTNHDAAVLP